MGLSVQVTKGMDYFQWRKTWGKIKGLMEMESIH